MAQELNQFSQSPVQGMMGLHPSTSIIECQVGSAEAGTLVAGQCVKIVDDAGGVPKVIAATADDADNLGFIVYNIKNAGFTAGMAVAVAIGYGAVIYLTASAAIARGAKLMVVIASKKVATATGGKAIIGWAMDKAAADGDLIRVNLSMPSYFRA